MLSSENILSCNDLQTVAIVKSDENYDNLRSTCQPLLNLLSENKCITVNGQTFDLELFVGGDMEFLQIVLGLGGSTGNFTCPRCKVHKDERFNVSKPWDFYHSTEMFRSVKEINLLSCQSKNPFGVKHKPLLSVDINHLYLVNCI